MVRGAYPGSFDPPTVAHLAVAEAAIAAGGLERLDLIVSREALGKEGGGRVSVPDRIEVLEAVVADRPALGVGVTEARLLADVAAGYDVLVVGADKWAQLHDPAWYGGSTAARDDALARLPRVLVAPRAGLEVVGAEVLDLDAAHLEVSSTGGLAGRGEWVLPVALDAARSDPARYGSWLVR